MQVHVDIPAWLAALIFLVVAAFVWAMCVLGTDNETL